MKKLIGFQNYLTGDVAKSSKAKLAFTALLSLVSSKNKSKIVRKIGPYLLDKKIKKENGFNPYFVGIYKKDNKKYFIKTWNGSIKDYNYQILVNELVINEVLYHKLLKGKIRTPKIIEYLLNKNSLSVVYEYIGGRLLFSYPLDFQTRIMSKIINLFKKASLKTNSKYLSILEKKDKSFYISSLSYITLLSLISSPKAYSLILNAYIKALVNLFNIRHSNLMINHGDLSPDNILVSKNKYYVLDCGRLALTLPEYDLTYISLNPIFSKLSKNVSRQLGVQVNQFLKIYLSLQYLKLQDPKTKNFNYLDNLKELLR